MDFEKSLNDFLKKTKELEKAEAIESQHQKGKLTARERINLLVDPGTFFEIDPFCEKNGLEGAVVCGFGKVEGRQIFLFSQDFSKKGGTLGEIEGKKIEKVYQLARRTGSPIIGIYDSGGARIQEGIVSLDFYGRIFKEQVKASGLIPQISIIVGPSAGGACYAPGLSDFIFMVDKISFMFITGPEVIKKTLGQEISFEELGGAKVHAEKSGVCHFFFEREEDCFLGVRKLLSYLPSNFAEFPPTKKSFLSEILETTDSSRILEILPEDEKKGYDMKEIIKEIFDKNSFFEVQENFAKNSIVGFARLDGKVVGIVANQPKYLAGVLDIDSSDKISRFIRFCDCFNIPIFSLVDCPGYLPGQEQEWGGIIRHGAKILYAISEATVPKISLILRKAIGGAFIALASKGLGYDLTICYPFSQISVLGPEQAVKIIYKKEIETKQDEKFEKEKIKEFQEKFMNPWEGLKQGLVDIVCHPKETRRVLIKAFQSISQIKSFEKVPKKHGNIPL